MQVGEQDQVYMRMALQLAQRAADKGEVPVGAVLVKSGEVMGEGYNSPIRLNDPSAHAEILAMRSAAKSTQNYRLPDTCLYVTVEPCSMCVGAMVHARIARLVYGAPEPKAGAVHSAIQLANHKAFNHKLTFVAGVLEDECAELMQRFFRERREAAKLKS